MFTSIDHSNRRASFMAAIVFGMAIAGGCTVFDAERWDPNRYRDERAVDIEERLGRDKPIVENPF